MVTQKEREKFYRELREKYIKLIHRDDEIYKSRVKISSEFLTIIDAALIKDFCYAENELTDIPPNEVHCEATKRGHTAVTIRNEYGERECPVYVQLDKDNHVISIRISLIE